MQAKQQSEALEQTLSVRRVPEVLMYRLKLRAVEGRETLRAVVLRALEREVEEK